MTRAGCVALLVLAGATAAQEAPPPLPLGAAASGIARAGTPATFVVEAKGAAVLTAVLTGEGDADLTLYVCDDEGQPLPDFLDESGQPFPGARADDDLLGARGTERLSVLLPAAGRYLVVVEGKAPGGRFAISGALAPAPALARGADPDGRPSAATPLVGDAKPVQVEGVVDPQADDLRDWFAVTAARAGTLSVVVRASEGDLRLDAFAPGDLRAAVMRSDDDEQGVPGHESVALPVKAGDVVLVRVAAVFLRGDRAAYRLVTAVVAE